MSEMKTPRTDIRVRLVGEDGNIFAILGRVRQALRRGGHPELADEVTAAVTSSHSYEEITSEKLRTFLKRPLEK